MYDSYQRIGVAVAAFFVIFGLVSLMMLLLVGFAIGAYSLFLWCTPPSLVPGPGGSEPLVVPTTCGSVSLTEAAAMGGQIAGDM